jgi:hypothetical protein
LHVCLFRTTYQMYIKSKPLLLILKRKGRLLCCAGAICLKHPSFYKVPVLRLPIIVPLVQKRSRVFHNSFYWCAQACMFRAHIPIHQVTPTHKTYKYTSIFDDWSLMYFQRASRISAGVVWLLHSVAAFFRYFFCHVIVKSTKFILETIIYLVHSVKTMSNSHLSSCYKLNS